MGIEVTHEENDNGKRNLQSSKKKSPFKWGYRNQHHETNIIGKKTKKYKKPILQPKFEYSKFCDINITSERKDIRMKNIVMDKFEVGLHNIDHRPLRKSHVKKIISAYNGVDVPISVAFSSIDNKFHVVDGQHRLDAVNIMIANGQKDKLIRYPCLILRRKDTGKRIDIANQADINLVHKVSYCSNEGSERTCVIDTIIEYGK
jgi:hypothetical protein